MIPLKKIEELIQKHSLLEKDLSSGKIEKKLFAEKSKEYADLNEIIKDAKKYFSYEKDRLEIQKNSIEKDSKIIVIDDLLATGGTAFAAGELIKKSGADLIGYAFLVELTELKGRKKLHSNVFVESLIKF